ncbi:hypothetical protein [Pseudoduganella violacea]|uniref:Glycosyltransferase RgtA/B/C/D-like domain-containing protein n=1 Tax=Pseudoduganella violacea TaxID=1715466 RepID=A0A7W5FTC5_9BURK|nr:hypothetical protein [Pseudoduganella violacea]MBB3118043.1 hypothetical protein [Pseudoduganella violacea]
MKSDKARIFIVWLILAGTASLLRFKTAIQTDALFLDALASDLLTHHGVWTEWKFARAPSFFPDMLLYLAAYFVLPDAPARIFWVSAIQVLLLGWTIVWTARQLAPGLSRRAQSWLLLLLALVTLTAARSNMWLYFYSTNNHIAAVILGLLGLVLYQRYLVQGGRLLALQLLLLGTLASLSTGLFTLSFTVPALLLCGLAWLLLRLQGSERLARRRLLLMGALLAAAEVLAGALGKVLLPNRPIEGEVEANPDTAANALKLFMRATKAAFAADNRLTQALAVLLLLAFAYLGWRLLRQVKLDAKGLRIDFGAAADWRLGASAAFLLLLLPINLLGVILSGAFVDPACYRYFVFPLTLGLMLAVILLECGGPRLRWTLEGLALLLALFLLASTVRVNRHPPVRTDLAQTVADCLAAAEQQGVPLKAGVADYWNSRAVSHYLPRHNPILATWNTLQPFFWVSTIGPVRRPQAYPEYQYNFAILNNPGHNDQFTYTPDTLGKLLPPPSRIHACPAAKVQLWLYDGNELDAAMRQILLNYRRQPPP